MPIILYGVGSMIVADVAETCARMGVQIAAWVKNIDGKTYEPVGQTIIRAEDVSAELREMEFVIPLFTPFYRRQAAEDARQRGFNRPRSLVDPTAIVATTTSFGAGCYFNSAANVGAAGNIGRFVFINRSASVGHHAEIGDFVSVGPGAVVAGDVRLGRGVVIAAGAIVLPGVEVGANAVIAAGAVVTKAIPPHCLVMGNPAKVKSEIAGYRDHSV